MVKIFAMLDVEFLVGENTSTIEVETETSLLDQALSQGQVISYSCRRGDCRQCVATLDAGDVGPVDAAKPYLQGNEIYLCNAIARSDLRIRLPYSPETEHVKVLRSPCKIHELRKLSPDVMEVVLRLPGGTDFLYVPGQYIRLTNKERITRSYSLADAPSIDRLLRIHVQCVDEGGFSQYVFMRAKLGDLLHLEGPLGRFVLRENETASQTIFLATGTGIAPVYAALSGMTSRQREKCGELFLYWGNRFRSNAYIHDELVELTQRLGARYFLVFSRESSDGSANSMSYVQDMMIKHHLNLRQAQVFAAGNIAMIDSSKELSLSLGLRSERFFSDPFTAS